MPDFTVEITATIRVRTRVTVTGCANEKEASDFAERAAADESQRPIWGNARPDLADRPRQIRVAFVGPNRRGRQD